LDYFVVTILLSLSLLVGIYLLQRFPNITKYLPVIRWFIRLVYDTFVYWKLNSKYRSVANIVLKYSLVIDAINFSKDNPRLSRAWVDKFVKDVKNSVGVFNLSDEESKKIAGTISVLLSHHSELLDVLSSFSSSDTIDIKRLTVIFIDTFGELYDLEDKLDKSMFEHLIFALNRVLVALKDKGYSASAYKEVGTILVRLRAICKVYSKQRLIQGRLTVAQFHKELDSVVAALHEVMTWKAADGK